MSSNFGILTGLINGGMRPATAPAPNVAGSDTKEMAAAYGGNLVSTDMLWSDYPTSDMSLQGAKRFEMPNVTKAMTIWTLFDNSSAILDLMEHVDSDDLSIMVEYTMYMPALTKKTSERARPHTVEHRHKTFRAVLERLAIGIELGYAMLKTQQGREVYANGLVQMKNATNESNALNILNTLANAQTPFRNPGGRYSTIGSGPNGKTFDDMLQLEKDFWMIFQRPETSGKAFQILNTLIERMQKPHMGEGDTYVMPRNMVDFNVLVPDQNTLNLFGGQEAVNRFNAGPNKVTSDGQGNAIVTFGTYQIEDEPPFNPFTRYIGYTEYNLFSETAKVNPAEYSDAVRTIEIYDIDQDTWAPIDSAYIINNCARFNKITGALLPLDHNDIARHDCPYEDELKNDSFNVKISVGGRTANVPVDVLGMIAPEYWTDQQKSSAVAVILAKMGKLTSCDARDASPHELPQVAKAIDDGLELIKSIEAIPFNNDAAAFLDEALDARGALPRAGTPRAIAAPVGYGSWVGLQRIADAFAAVGLDEGRFTTTYGFPGSVGKRAHAFVAVFNDFVAYLRDMLRMSHVLEPEHCAPWWPNKTPAQAAFDTLVSQYRLPLIRGAAAAASSTPVASGRLSVTGTSASIGTTRDGARAFLEANFTGYLVSGAELSARRAPYARGVARGPAVPIASSINAGASDQEAVFIDPDQTGSGPITDLNTAGRLDALLSTMPSFARLYSDADTSLIPGSATARAIKVVRGSPPADGQEDAYDTLVAAAMAPLGAAPLTNAQLVAQAVLLIALGTVRTQGISSAEVGRNIIALYDGVFEAYLPRDTLKSGNGPDVLDPLVANLAAVMTDLEAFLNSDGGRNTRLASPAQVRNAINKIYASVGFNFSSAAAADTVRNANVSSFVYSPSQLVSARGASFGNWSFASTNDFNNAMSNAEYTSNVTAIGNPTGSNLAPALADNDTRDPIARSALALALAHSSGSRSVFAYVDAKRNAAPAADVEMPDATQNATAAYLASIAGSAQGLRPASAGSGNAADDSGNIFKTKESVKRNRTGMEALNLTPAARKRKTHVVDSSLLDRLLYASAFTRNWTWANSNPSSKLWCWTAMALMLTPFNSQQLLIFAEKGLKQPFSALLFRTMILGMDSIIKVKRRGFGPFISGNRMWTWNWDGVSRIFAGHWSYYAAPIITVPANVFHAFNVFASAYLTGFGTLPYGADDTTPVAFANDLNPDQKAVWICLEPANNPRGHYPTKIALTGFLSHVTAQYGITTSQSKSPDYVNAYCHNLQFGHYAEMLTAQQTGVAATIGFEPGHTPWLAFRGCQKNYDPVTRRNTIKTDPAGNFPKSMYDTGLKATLMGKLGPAPGTVSLLGAAAQ